MLDDHDIKGYYVTVQQIILVNEHGVDGEHES